MPINVLLWIALSLALNACGGANSGSAAAKNQHDAPRQQAALTVDLTQPEQRQSAQPLATAGGLFAWQEVAIGAEVSGYRVSAVLVDVGDAVRKGQVLAKLDDSLLRENWQQAEASVAVASATLAQAQAAARRGNALQAPGVISKQDAEQLNTNAATASAQLLNAQSLLQAAQQRLEYANIRSPDAGVIAARNVVPGQIPVAGAALFALIRQSRVEWRAEVPAQEISRVRRGMHASIERADGTLASGTVRTVSPGLDANTQRGIAYVDLQLEAQVRPGMYANGSIALAPATVITVPLAAVSVRDGFSYVFVLLDNHTVRQQRIEVRRLLSDAVEVSSGVGTAEQIVASGVGFLHDGDLVKVNAAAKTPS
jgi:HlyD family secretion protein